MVSEVSVTLPLAASQKEVYDAFTNPERMSDWMGDRVEADPRVGGTYRFEIADGTGSAFVHRGTFTVLEPSRIVRTLQAGPKSAVDAGPTVDPTDEIEALLKPVSPRQTELTFINRWRSGDLDAGAANAVKEAWIGWLAGLEASLGRA